MAQSSTLIEYNRLIVDSNILKGKNMILNNGILIKIIDEDLFGKVPRILDEKNSEPKGVFEVNYWKNCWNVREEILTYLGASDDEWLWKLDINDLNEIARILKNLYYEKNWVEERSEWSFAEIKKLFRRRLKKMIRIAKKLKKKNPKSYEIIFYDNY